LNRRSRRASESRRLDTEDRCAEIQPMIAGSAVGGPYPTRMPAGVRPTASSAGHPPLRSRQGASAVWSSKKASAVAHDRLPRRNSSVGRVSARSIMTEAAPGSTVRPTSCHSAPIFRAPHSSVNSRSS
jgi:hypothetical protein